MPEAYLLNWTAAIVALALGAALISAVFAISWFLAPHRPSADKAMPYESGIRPAPYSWSQFHIRYYVFAILFLIFDVEAVFLFPWAVVFMKVKEEFSSAVANAVFYEMFIFIAILLFGIVYGWRKGVLQWR